MKRHALTLILLTAVALAAAGVDPEAHRLAFAVPVEDGPALDGRLDDACWRQAPVSAPWLNIYDNAREAVPATTFRIVFDALRLYVGVQAEESEPFPPAPGEPPVRDLWPAAPSVELFLDANCSRSAYVQLATALAGGRYDSRITDTTWNGTWEAVAAPVPGGWCMEIAVPFADLGQSRPENGAAWGLNACRNRPGGLAGSSTWAPVGGNFHNPGRFGTLILGTPQHWWDRTRRLLQTESTRLRQALAGQSTAAGLMRRLAAADALLTAAPGVVPGADGSSEFLVFYAEVEAWGRRYHEVADEAEAMAAIRNVRK
jgi:hypothetical protein